MCVCQNWFMSSLNFKNKITCVLITLDNVNKANKTKKNDIPLFQAFAAQNIYKEWWIHPSLKDLHYGTCVDKMCLFFDKKVGLFFLKTHQIKLNLFSILIRARHHQILWRTSTIHLQAILKYDLLFRYFFSHLKVWWFCQDRLGDLGNYECVILEFQGSKMSQQGVVVPCV